MHRLSQMFTIVSKDARLRAQLVAAPDSKATRPNEVEVNAEQLARQDIEARKRTKKDPPPPPGMHPDQVMLVYAASEVLAGLLTYARFGTIYTSQRHHVVWSHVVWQEGTAGEWIKRITSAQKVLVKEKKQRLELVKKRDKKARGLNRKRSKGRKSTAAAAPAVGSGGSFNMLLDNMNSVWQQDEDHPLCRVCAKKFWSV